MHVSGRPLPDRQTRNAFGISGALDGLVPSGARGALAFPIGLSGSGKGTVPRRGNRRQAPAGAEEGLAEDVFGRRRRERLRRLPRDARQ